MHVTRLDLLDLFNWKKPDWLVVLLILALYVTYMACIATLINTIATKYKLFTNCAMVICHGVNCYSMSGT